MLASKTSRGSRRRGPSDRRARRRPIRKSRAAQSARPTTNTKAAGNETSSGSGGAAGGEAPIRIRRGETSEKADSADNSAANEATEATEAKRRTPDSVAPTEVDPEGEPQLSLDLSDPEPRGYEASEKPPRARADTTRWLWAAMGMGAVTCPVLLGFQLVFTDPAHGLNVLAVVATMSFGALFATWTFEYWLKRGEDTNRSKSSVWTLTRHSVLASVGVAAMAVSALNRTASFGLLFLVIFTLLVADVVLRRLRIR